jgi:hypothetical protein
MVRWDQRRSTVGFAGPDRRHRKSEREFALKGHRRRGLSGRRQSLVGGREEAIKSGRPVNRVRLEFFHAVLGAERLLCRTDQSAFSGVVHRAEDRVSAHSTGTSATGEHVESFHAPLRDEFLNVSWFENLWDARRKSTAWKEDHNERRPHSSLGYRTPAEYARQLLLSSGSALRRPKEWMRMSYDPTCEFWGRPSCRLRRGLELRGTRSTLT